MIYVAEVLSCKFVKIGFAEADVPRLVFGEHLRAQSLLCSLTS